MVLNKVIAQKELKIFGGQPNVNRFWNDSESISIDILKCDNTPQQGIQSCATIGLNAIDIGIVNGGHKIRIEVLGAIATTVEQYSNIIASVAFEIMNTEKCYPGYIARNIIEQYVEETEMKHILLTDPFLWDDAKSFQHDNILIAWLMAVPISETELL